MCIRDSLDTAFFYRVPILCICHTVRYFDVWLVRPLQLVCRRASFCFKRSLLSFGRLVFLPLPTHAAYVERACLLYVAVLMYRSIGAV